MVLNHVYLVTPERTIPDPVYFIPKAAKHEGDRAAGRTTTKKNLRGHSVQVPVTLDKDLHGVQGGAMSQGAWNTEEVLLSILGSEQPHRGGDGAKQRGHIL
ncbi:unnamed protein product [Boreogadus saida]